MTRFTDNNTTTDVETSLQGRVLVQVSSQFDMALMGGFASGGAARIREIRRILSEALERSSGACQALCGVLHPETSQKRPTQRMRGPFSRLTDSPVPPGPSS